MALEKTLAKKSIRIALENGLTSNGKMRTQSRTFSNVKESATDEKVLEVAQVLGELYSKPTHEIRLVEESVLKDVL